eukprot:7727505-Pyramimonas_sp.AAC.1
MALAAFLSIPAAQRRRLEQLDHSHVKLETAQNSDDVNAPEVTIPPVQLLKPVRWSQPERAAPARSVKPDVPKSEPGPALRTLAYHPASGTYSEVPFKPAEPAPAPTTLSGAAAPWAR